MIKMRIDELLLCALPIHVMCIIYGLTNRMGSISCHIMSLVINSLRAHTHTHIQTSTQEQFQETWRASGLKCSTMYSIVQNLSNKQSAKVIYRFDRLRTSHSNRQKNHMQLEKLSSAHASNFIVLRVNHGLISCKDLAYAYHCNI